VTGRYSALPWDRMTRLVSSLFGAGLILRRLRGADSGSGTVGAAFAGIFAFSLGQATGWPWVAAAAVALVTVGIWSTTALAAEVGDAGWIVIDEAAGMFVAMIGVLTWPAALGAFVVFRAADILKNWFPGVTAAERLSGGWGIMGDDVVAGLYGLAAGHLIQWLLT
jgi:phosphatidylglycerophosphatase A